MTADEVKQAIARRHPAMDPIAGPGEWTVLEEYANIDVLAISSWGDARNVGYEVKVSRSDYRAELLNPSKRARAVERCHEFYFAVPRGLLRPEELDFVEPVEWQSQLDLFERDPCPGIPRHDYRFGGRCTSPPRRSRTSTEPKTGHIVTVPVPAVLTDHKWGYVDRSAASRRITCPTCNGTGYAQKSAVEREAPTLWVPRDVGLVEIDGRGCHVTVKAPKRRPARPFADKEQARMVRWASYRPDRRHRERLAEATR